MARELGPVMVAILLAGRVGSAIAAELASMKVYQEVDALVTMNIPPARMLVLPPELGYGALGAGGQLGERGAGVGRGGGDGHGVLRVLVVEHHRGTP